MPKVLRIINRFNLGGPTFNAAYLTKYLAPEFETEKSEDSSEFIVRELGVDYLIIEDIRRSIDFNRDRKAYRQIKEIIRSFKPDIVHTHASKAGFLGRLAAIQENVPIIVHTFHGHVFHSYFGAFKTYLYKSIERYLAKRSTKIIAISDEQKRELVEEHRICNPEKMTVIRLGFDLSKFQKNMDAKRKLFRSYYGLQNDEVAIGIVGRIVPVKNHQLFLKAVAEVKQKSKVPIKAFIIGDGSDKNKTKQIADTLGLTNEDFSGTGVFKEGKLSRSPDAKNGKSDIIFTSWIREIDFVYAGLDLICLTSLNEGTPVSLIEAQASGKAVLSTRVGGVENIVENGKSGLLSELSLTNYVDRLLSLVENPQKRESMGIEGCKWIGDKYDYTRLVTEMKNLYAQLLPSD